MLGFAQPAPRLDDRRPAPASLRVFLLLREICIAGRPTLIIPPEKLVEATFAATRHLGPEEIATLLVRPTIIVSAPRAGSNLLFELLSNVEGLWTIGRESHAIYNVFPHLRAENEKLDSGCLHEAHADLRTSRLWRAIFLYMLRDRQGRPFLALPPAQCPATFEALEKTPRNALNIPFLLTLFPQARFILLHREARANVASLVEAWKAGLDSGRFVTFLDLPGWDRRAWCFLLPPGWRAMVGKSLVEIAAFQWSACNGIVLDQLARLPPERWTVVSYEDLIADPSRVRASLCRFINPDLRSDAAPVGAMPLSRTTLTPPNPDKWKKYEQELAALQPGLDAVSRRISETSGTGRS